MKKTAHAVKKRTRKTNYDADDEERDASARLIAEAPAMLDALRDSVRRCEGKLRGDGIGADPVWLQNYRALLARIDTGTTNDSKNEAKP